MKCVNSDTKNAVDKVGASGIALANKTKDVLNNLEGDNALEKAKDLAGKAG